MMICGGFIRPKERYREIQETKKRVDNYGPLTVLALVAFVTVGNPTIPLNKNGFGPALRPAPTNLANALTRRRPSTNSRVVVQVDLVEEGMG